jgi:cytochrome c
MQFIFGPLLFLTLPAKGVTWGLFWVILAGATIAGIVLYQLWKMLNEGIQIPGKRFYLVLGLFTFWWHLWEQAGTCTAKARCPPTKK